MLSKIFLKKNKKRVIIHAGMTKTGSTSLQFSLYNNKEALAEEGILYPDTQGSNNHYFLIEGKKNIGTVISEIKNSPHNIAIISCELFYNLKDERVKSIYDALNKYFDLEVLIFIRNHIEWLESIYGQHVGQYEHQYMGDIDDFILDFNEHLNFYSIVEKLKEEVKHVHVIGYDYSKAYEGIIQSFFTKLSFPKLSINLGVESIKRKANPSFCFTSLFIMKLMNKEGLIKSRDDYIKISRYLKFNSNPCQKTSFIDNDKITLNISHSYIAKLISKLILAK